MLTFRNSKVIYYGPHACDNCGAEIVKMGIEFGGNMFDQPSGPIYPNTEWHVHVCDPKRVAMKPRPIPLVSEHTVPMPSKLEMANIAKSEPKPR